MAFVGGRVVSLALENVSEMPTTITAHYFSSGHSKGAIRVASDGAGYRVKVCRPSTPGGEFVSRFVERSLTSGAGIDTCLRHVLIVISGKRRLGSFLAEDTELLFAMSMMVAWAVGYEWSRPTFVKHSPPLVVASLVWVRHVGLIRRTEEGADEGDCRHGLQGGGPGEWCERPLRDRQMSDSGVAEGVECADYRWEGRKAHRYSS